MTSKINPVKLKSKKNRIFPSFKNLNFRQNSKLKSGFYTIKIIKKTFKYFSNQISKNRIFRQIALGILLIFTRVFEFRILYNEKYLDFSRQISKTGIFSRQFSKIIFLKSNFKINFFFFSRQIAMFIWFEIRILHSKNHTSWIFFPSNFKNLILLLNLFICRIYLPRNLRQENSFNCKLTF